MKRIKLTNLLNESSPGFENRQVGDALPTLDSVRNAYQAKKALQEAESFTAINKDSGKVSVFKTKDGRDSAIKAGTHDKKKAVKGGDSPPAGKDTPKVNIFDKPSDKETPTPKKDKKVKSSEPSKFDIEAIEDMEIDEFDDLIDKNKSKLSKQQIDKLTQLSGDWEDAEDDMIAAGDDEADAEFQSILSDIKADIEKILSEPKSEPSKSRPGNTEVNKVVSGKAKKLGITPQKLGKEEYEKRMSQAAVEALTDANFHSESRALIAVLEDNPELAKNPSDDPNKPDMFSDEYDEWKKGTAWGSSFGDSSDGTDDIAHSATGESSWDGQESIDAIAFDLKMNGSHKLAAKIQSIFDEKNESTSSISDMIPESVVINEGTRSQVGVIGSNGKIISAYVHYDGYPSNMKPGLKKHMKSDKDVLKLIKMGGARGIFDDKDIEYYKSGQPQKGDSKDVAGYIKDADRKNGAEFVYLYNMKDKKWYYADTYKDTELKKLF